MSTLHRLGEGIASVISFVLLVAVVAGIVVVRTSTAAGATAPPDALRANAADGLDAALGPGGSGLSFEVVQTSTLRAKPSGPRIELRSEEDPETVTAVVDEYQIGTLLSRGGATADAFWMDILIGRNGTDFASADLFARVLYRDGELWRDDGVGWYLTDQSPGVGIDPVTLRALAGALRSLADVKAAEPAWVDGRILAGVAGSSNPTAFPGVIAADGAEFTEKSFPVDLRFDDNGRLVRLEATARNLNQDTFDLIATTVVTFSYGSPGDPPKATPTMAPEALPTSEPEATQVKA